MDTILEQLRKNNMTAHISGEEKENSSDDKKEKSVSKEEPALRGRYRCRACGYIFDEAEEGKPFSTLKECPLCHIGPSGFMKLR